MTSEMNPSPVTIANPAEKPAKSDAAPAAPVPTVASSDAATANETGSCGTSAKPDMKSESGSCSTTPKADAASTAAPAIKSESSDHSCCASFEKDGKPATSGSN